MPTLAPSPTRWAIWRLKPRAYSFITSMRKARLPTCVLTGISTAPWLPLTNADHRTDCHPKKKTRLGLFFLLNTSQLQNKSTQVFILRQCAQLRIDIRRINMNHILIGSKITRCKDTSSSNRSITVCKRRAPIFSVRSFTCQAISANRRMPS